jgi:TonB family protein
MRQPSLSNASRGNADKDLLIVLLVGLGSSIAIHILAIFGAGYLWKSTAVVDESMEITMVEDDPSKTVITPPPAPKVTPVVPIIKSSAIIEPKIKTPKIAPAVTKAVPIVKSPATIIPKTKTPTKTIPVAQNPSKPATNSLSSSSSAARPIASPVTPDELFKSPPPNEIQPASQPEIAQKQEPAVKPSVLPSPKIAPNSTISPSPILTPKVARKPTPVFSPEIAPNPQPIIKSSPVPSPKIVKNPPVKSPERDVLDNASSDENVATVAPSKNNLPIAANPRKSPNVTPSGLANDPFRDEKIVPSKINNPTSSKVAGFGGNNPNITIPSKVATESKVGEKIGGNSGSTSRNSGSPDDGSTGNNVAANSRTAGLQCVNRCEIDGLTDLQDNDGGKDKLRIKIAVDPQGIVTSATIAKSSGNSNIDRIIINGVKQMQFSPPGQRVETVVKANILI